MQSVTSSLASAMRSHVLILSPQPCRLVFSLASAMPHSCISYNSLAMPCSHVFFRLSHATQSCFLPPLLCSYVFFHLGHSAHLLLLDYFRYKYFCVQISHLYIQMALLQNLLPAKSFTFMVSIYNIYCTI